MKIPDMTWMQSLINLARERFQGSFFLRVITGTRELCSATEHWAYKRGKHLCGGTKSLGSTLSCYGLEKEKNVGLTERWDWKNVARCCGFLREEQWRNWNKAWERKAQVTGLGYSKIKGRTQLRCYILQLLHKCAKSGGERETATSTLVDKARLLGKYIYFFVVIEVPVHLWIVFSGWRWRGIILPLKCHNRT